MSRRPLSIIGLLAALSSLGPAAALAKDGGKGSQGGRHAAPMLAGSPALTLRLGHMRGGAALILSRVAVSGTVSPYAAGQIVDLSYYRDGRAVMQRKVNVTAGAGGAGVFRDSFYVGEDGRYAIAASVEQGGTQTASAPRRTFGVFFPTLYRGASGPVARAFKRGLRELGFDPGGGTVFDDRTAREVLAYRKVNNLARDMQANSPIVRSVLDGKGGFSVRFPGAGNHAEVSLSKQVLVLTRGARPYAVYPVSTGKPSTPTVRGHFQFYRRQPGYNAEGMYFSFYFIGGYAVHGYASVPNYPASHGCVRTFIADQPRIYDQLRYGESIFVY